MFNLCFIRGSTADFRFNDYGPRSNRGNITPKAQNQKFETGATPVLRRSRTGDGFGRAVSRFLSAPLAKRRESFVLAADTRDPSRLRGTWSEPLRGPLFGLAPDGVFRAPPITRRAVVSYTTFSPLPAPLAQRRRFVFCGTVRRNASRRRRPRVSQLVRAWVTRHRALWCSDFPPPAHAGSDSPPFQNRREHTLTGQVEQGAN